MKNWITLCSDANWADYHGMWMKRSSSDDSVYVLQFTNMWDACGESEDLSQYTCEVKRIDLSELSDEAIDSALKSCGYSLTCNKDNQGEIVNDDSGDVVATGKSLEACLVECCIQYGLGAPLASFDGNKLPANVRANARRFAESCMKDSKLLEEKLNRTVNAIGSTAQEYGVGDIDSALFFFHWEKLVRAIKTSIEETKNVTSY